jgi:23S rRNA pseudouridine1911/1915/1917 synthase
MLHARVLGFVHPRSGERLLFERPPPEDFNAMLESLRARR